MKRSSKLTGDAFENFASDFATATELTGSSHLQTGAAAREEVEGVSNLSLTSHLMGVVGFSILPNSLLAVWLGALYEKSLLSK